ncbi:MAG: peptidoglycan DD-metalloendopeptidase family protein [Pseudomonadota bacterium]
MKKLCLPPACTALVILSLLPGILRAESSADPTSKKDQIEKIETDLTREKEKFLTFGRKEESLLGQLSDLEKTINEQRELLGKLKEKIGQSKKALRRSQDKLRGIEDELKEVESRLARRLVSFYKYAKRGYLQLLGSSAGLNQLRRRIKYLTVVLEEDQHLFRQMADIQMNYKKEIGGIRAQLTAIDSLENSERARLQTIKNEMDKKVLLLMKIHKEKEFYETAVKELELAAKDLREKLLDLERIPQKKEAVAVALPKDFAEYKGKLTLPFRGKVQKGRGPLGSSQLNSFKGIYIKGPAGGEVRAVFRGRVDYSGWLKGYGQIIVINHGLRYFTVSAHLLERFKSEGQAVEKGEVIGLIGETGVMGGPNLYFEIRKGGEHLDPFEWLKVH